jgi:hypothetical protein
MPSVYKIALLCTVVLGHCARIMDAGWISTQRQIPAFLSLDLSAPCRKGYQAFGPRPPHVTRDDDGIITARNRIVAPPTRSHDGGQMHAKRKTVSDSALIVEPPTEHIEKRERATRKKSPQLLEEFALRAAILLRESGGRMSSELFQTRWKCTFPRDDIAKYKQGLSLKGLFKQCGDNFLVQEMSSGVGTSARSVTALILVLFLATSIPNMSLKALLYTGCYSC